MLKKPWGGVIPTPFRTGRVKKFYGKHIDLAGQSLEKLCFLHDMDKLRNLPGFY